jgi:Xaa-Pro aminopeptidase
MTLDARLERLRRFAAREGLDAVVATSDASIAYFTGYDGAQLERLYAAVVRVDGGGALLGHEMAAEALDAAPTRLTRATYPAASSGIPELLATLRGARRVGVEERHISYGRARTLGAHGHDLVFAERLVMALRAQKDAREIAAIERSCAAIAGVLEQLFATLAPGAVERDVNAQVDAQLRRLGATETHPLILFGPNSARPHGAPGERALAAGDVVVADVSACIDGYWGDLTRCASAGPPTAWARAAWTVVREAHTAAIATMRPGVAATKVDAVARAIVEGRPDLGACLHGVGHLIGREVHEAPSLVPGVDAVLDEGMVAAIEPGIYRAGTGGLRLEDEVLVAADGPRLLSHLPLELHVLSA